MLKDAVVLHRLGTLLQKRSRVIEVDRHGQLGDVFADGVFDDGPDAHLHVWVFEPGQLHALTRFELFQGYFVAELGQSDCVLVIVDSRRLLTH